jgi:hypothetical protein
MLTSNNQTKIIITGLVVLCTLLLGSSIYFATRSNSQNNFINTSKSSTKTVEINPNELTPAAIPAGYPQKLSGLKRNSNEGVTFNIAQKYEIKFEQKQDTNQNFSNNANGYFSRVTNSFANFSFEDADKLSDRSYSQEYTKVANSFILSNLRNKGGSKLKEYSIINHIYRNPEYVDKGIGYGANKYTEAIKTTGTIIQSIYPNSAVIDENIVWFGTGNLPVKIDSNNRHGVAIYNKNLNEKGLMGTYLRDYDAEIDTKISNQVCTNITFTQDNFICLNDYETLVNLNTGEEFGKYNQFIDTNDGYLYAKDVDNTMIYKVELNNPKNATKIYSVKENEVISHFSYTSQKELLVQITTSTPQPGILAPKVKARTIELKPDGSVLERPEFKDVRIFI